MTNGKCRLVLAALVLTVPVFAATAGAQTRPAAASTSVGNADTDAAVSAEFNELHFGGFGGVGVDADYWTKPFGGESSTIHAGLVVEGGFHHFSGESVTSITGGVHLTDEKIGNERIHAYGNALVGIGHISFDNGNGGTQTENDKIFALMPGLEFSMKDKSYKIRVEVGPLFDFFDGGHEVAWRYSIGAIFPMK